MFAVVTLTALLAVLTLAVLTATGRPDQGRSRLRWSALVVTVAVAAALTPYWVTDSGSASLYLLGIPLAAVAVPVAAAAAGAGQRRAGLGQRVADVAGAVVLTGWALVLALGVGTAFLPGALLLIIVAVLGLVPQAPPAT
jgi:hypothetical protein